MSTFVKTKHDIGLLKQDGTTTVGLRLAKDKNGIPIYRTFDDEYLAQQFYSGSPDYNNLPPEKELSLRQNDWRSGFGLEVYDANDPKRYFSSIGMDMRYKGMAVAGPISTAIYGTAGWRSGTSTTGSGGTWTSPNNVYDEDTTTKATQSVTSDSWGLYLQINIASTPCDSFRYFVGRANANIDLFDIDVYYSAAWNSIISSGVPTLDAWTTVAVGSTQNITAARIRFHNADAINPNDAYIYEFDFNVAGNVTLGQVKDFAEFNDLLYICTATELWKQNTGGTGFTYVRGFPAAITDLEIFTDNKLYILQGLSNAYWEMTTAEAFTINTLAVNKFNYFCRVDAATPTMWGSDSLYTIRSTINPANGGTAWSAQTTVDTSFNDITDMIAKSGALYIMKEDMPYYLSSAGAVQSNLAPELKSLRASTSGKNVFLWKNKLYIPFGTQGLLETDGTTNTFLNPASYCTNLSDFVGRVMAVAGDEEWLFVAVDNSTKIEILAGREETIDGTTSWVWHPIHELTLTGCEKLFASSVYQKRLWIASTSSSDSLYYIPLPTGYGNLTADANRNFLTNSYMITSWLHGNFRGDTKAYIKITVLLGHAYDADIYFECWYEKLEDSSWTDAGDFKGTATSRIATLYIPVDGSSNKPKSTMMRFKFLAKTDDTQKTPILLGYDCRAILYPTNRRIIECEVMCEDDLILKDGMVEKGQAATIKTALEEARNATWPVTFYPLNWESSGNTIYVKFLPLQMVITKDEKGRTSERHYLLRLQEVALS